ncbi:hypothetical protein ACFY19_34440 [Streptosporangium saharense]
MLAGTLAAIKEVGEGEDLLNKLVIALEGDSRVVTVGSAVHRKDWMHTRTIYPRINQGIEGDILGSQNRLAAVSLSDPLSFTVNVPIKNQPRFRGCEDVPTDTYHVAWDGITAVVIWEIQRDDNNVPRSGGHVIVDILKDASEKIGLDLVAQACSPGCTNIFTHKILRIERFGGKGIFYTEAIDDLHIKAHIHATGDALQVAINFLKSIKFTGEVFAIFKNSSRHILDIEKFCRELVDDLLGLNYSVIQWKRLSIRARIKGWKIHRSQRRQMQNIIAILWLVLADVEALRRDWLQNRRTLLNSLAKPLNEHLYDRDRSDDDDSVMSQDLSFIRAAIEQAAVRSDTRMVAIATIYGALGGMVGGLIGGLLS